jgi:1-acyl-sn-glycerol-3-phosphate acyltransferase
MAHYPRPRRPIDLLMAPASAVIWPAATTWMMGLAAISLAGTTVRPFHTFQRWFPAPQMGSVIHFAGGRYKVVRDPLYDPARPTMYMQNHVSVLDGHAACHAIPGPFCGLHNASHLKVPGYGWVMALANAVPVPKGQGRFRVVARLAKERASRGISILAFPEGTRKLQQETGTFRQGVFRIARDAGLPVVPLATRGLEELLPKGHLILRPATVQIYLGPTIETEGLDDAELDRVIAGTRTIIDHFVQTGEPSGAAVVAELGLRVRGMDIEGNSTAGGGRGAPTASETPAPA